MKHYLILALVLFCMQGIAQENISTFYSEVSWLQEEVEERMDNLRKIDYYQIRFNGRDHHAFMFYHKKNIKSQLLLNYIDSWGTVYKYLLCQGSTCDDYDLPDPVQYLFDPDASYYTVTINEITESELAMVMNFLDNNMQVDADITYPDVVTPMATTYSTTASDHMYIPADAQTQSLNAILTVVGSLFDFLGVNATNDDDDVDRMIKLIQAYEKSNKALEKGKITDKQWQTIQIIGDNLAKKTNNP